MTSALDNLGPHLLGRVPSKPDSRNYQLETFQSTDPVDVALAALLKDKSVAKGTKAWAQFEAPYLKSVTPVGPTPPPPPPPPPPASGAVVWTDAEPVLDQGQYGTCVGNGGAQWGNTLPVDDKFTEGMGQSATNGGPYARAIYYECTVIDGQPDDPNATGGGQQGSTVHSLAKALQNRKLLSTYAFASTTDAVTKFIKSSGPVVIGIDWYNDMFNPDPKGLITPTGGVAGGHCVVLLGWHPAGELFPDEVYEGLNSWSDSWGVKGHFFLKVTDFATLLNGNGEALAAVEL